MMARKRDIDVILFGLRFGMSAKRLYAKFEELGKPVEPRSFLDPEMVILEPDPEPLWVEGIDLKTGKRYAK